MSEQQVLFAPKVVTDDWQADAHAMASEHVLVEVQNRQYRFFHESFFDYAYARRFCATNQGIVELLTSSEQHLFRRAQVRQILAYRREHDFRQYLINVRQIFESPTARFHIKRMVASGFSRINNPRPMSGLCLNRTCWTAIFRDMYLPRCTTTSGGSTSWTRNASGAWLASDDVRLKNAAIWYLEARGLHDGRSKRIAELITPYVKRDDEEWRKRILRIMSWGNAHKSSEMTAIYLDLIAHGIYNDYKGSATGSDFWSQHYDAEKESPRFIVDVLATWFDWAVKQFDDGESVNFLDKCGQNRSHTGSMILGKAASEEPEYFIEKMLPRVLAVILKTELSRGDRVLNREWPFLSNHGEAFDINDAILLHLRKSLQYLAKNNVEVFRKHAATITAYPQDTFSYLLLRCLGPKIRKSLPTSALSTLLLTGAG